MMQISPAPLIYILIFAAVVFAVEGLYLTVFGKSISLNSRMSRRLAPLENTHDREKVLEQLRKKMNHHVNARGIPLYSLLAHKAQRANIAFTPKALIGNMVGLSVFAYAFLTIGTEANAVVRLVVALETGVGGVYFWINSKAKKRMSLEKEQLPDAVELMVRSLRVCHPFSDRCADHDHHA